MSYVKEQAIDILLAFHFKYNGDWDKIRKAVADRKQMDFKKYLEGIDTSNYITIVDDNYPAKLFKTKKPPFVIDKRELKL